MPLPLTEIGKSMKRGRRERVGEDHGFGFRHIEFVIPFKHAHVLKIDSIV